MRGTGIMDGASKTLLARALYDNHPDCLDELAFCRGDILTILEQNVPESEGWWKCLLHGKQGLAPANRLQILLETPADLPYSPALRGPEKAPEEASQVPALLHPPPAGSVYEQMKGWVEGPLLLSDQVYEFPDPPASARIICEKTLTFPRQALVSLPRPTRASLPTLPTQVYDVPAQSRVLSVDKEPEKQPLYDIPSRPHKAGPCQPTSHANEPLTPVVAVKNSGYHSLPSPQKSEWIYKTPLSPGKASVRSSALRSLAEETGSPAAPSPGSADSSPPGIRARSLPAQPSSSVPTKKKLSLPEVTSHHVLVLRATLPADESVGHKLPSSFLGTRGELRNTKPNIYDIPKATLSVRQAETEPRKAEEAVEPSLKAACFSRWHRSPSPETDTHSISSSDSRASVLSSCSSMSTDSSSEESARELTLDLDWAREMVMALQHKVVSSAAGLMLFVSRKWRSRDYMEANINAIHRAADHTEASLREFLDFARGICGTACSLTDSNLHARIRDQLHTISRSYQTLLETKASLDSCGWSLEVLVTDQVQNNPDDLERFVMVARMVPEDIKRFASMVIANGKLLFKNCRKAEASHLSPNADLKCEECIRLPQGEMESCPQSTPCDEPRESHHRPALLNSSSACGQSPGSLCPHPPVEQNPRKKLQLSEHCRLYFGALFKALSVFHSSLSHSPPPETFITQSKLIVLAGQKLVDTLCRETQEKDVRNEVLCSSSHLCGLLKDLALATKNAVLKYPSPAALGQLRAEAERLEQHTRLFRGTLE
ncbi:cas scaffolding protein family member 4 [Ochotona princeps]|uniref:cas scaffolding protein family member 4 n=1 Tax=Ochotona princeps TaxID=9978 RepID=UPI002714C79B|nr:cas scaffolding protein family member 4 [Ochotona princeps]